MPSTSRKRRQSPKPSDSSPSKRRRKPQAEDIIVISDSDSDDIQIQNEVEDKELQDLLDQIKAQEENERYARELQKQFDLEDLEEQASPIPGTSAKVSESIDLEDDAVFARSLAKKWSAEEDVISIRSSPEICNSDLEYVDEPPAKQPIVSSKGKKRAEQSEGTSSTAAPRSEAPLIPPDESFLPYRALFVAVNPCSKCNKRMNIPKGLVSFVDSVCPPGLTHLLHVTCRSCKIVHCRGCFKPHACPITCKGASENPDCTIHTCCPEIRAIALFHILDAFDTCSSQEKASFESRTQALMKKNTVRKSAASVGPGGTGYATGSTGVGGGRGGRQGPNTPASSRRKGSLDWQDVLIRAFEMLAAFLPAPYSDDAREYDLLPHPSLGHLIALSQLPSILADLLRNDSVSDWIAQKDMYNAMLILLRRMADSELTIQCLIAPRWEANQLDGLGDWMRSGHKIAWDQNDEGKPVVQPPLYTHFRKLTLQSEAFLKGAEQMLANDASESAVWDVLQGTSLAGDIIVARDDLERAISVLGKTVSAGPQHTQSISKPDKGKARAASSDPDTLYQEACEKLALKYISLASERSGGLLYANFNYAANLKETENAMRQSKDHLRMVKELAVTATSLPAGIWVRVDEVRNDAMKIMIAGPAGTPYAGGLFEFDCFLPIEYPNKPPHMHLRTTGGGSVRFNPNLYNCGKVCLSLLGTWPGRPEEQWTSKSTLLQVLVSIQSMILVEAPYFNEPGHGPVRPNHAASIGYNRNICKQTIRWAIVDWLKTEHQNGIWRDVIASHFMIHRVKIRQQIVDWIASVPEICAYTADVHPHAYYGPGPAAPGYRTTNHLHNRTAGRNLLDDFDKGMKLIESWKTA
ncbi:hypothetical protein CVT24_007841 [Panaeolus cyanescens]|uniref:UBC core domain-containing protein n=1 Tax=Panaeolus cyanescens TaxID=181874 RepID=A0A409VZI2_9AGAR|nr:hypothetical protein CVT24_007841 [Panaeolus cyanescens]